MDDTAGIKPKFHYRMKKLPYGKLIAVLLFIFSFFILSSDDITAYFERLMGEGLIAPFAFLAILIVAVVLAPVAVLPLIPLATSLFGPLVTALLSILGFTVGAVIAFVLAQKIGQPILHTFLPFNDIEGMEKRLPPASSFWGVVGLRMILPVDILSYALGLFSSMPLKTYTLATLIGVSPFAFIFSYGGAAWESGSLLLLFGLIALGIFVYVVVWRRLRGRGKEGDQKKP